jgi:deazaflavin-dependent oxidoreductase (nitroreductase family)
MAKEYRITTSIRVANRLMKFLIRAGLVPKPAYILTVRGRKTGKLYSTPVSLVENDDGRWLVAPYSENNWVRNARAAGEATIARRGYKETLPATEVPVDERAPILKTYFDRERFARAYTDFTPETSLETYAEKASNHPVFKLG